MPARRPTAGCAAGPTSRGGERDHGDRSRDGVGLFRARTVCTGLPGDVRRTTLCHLAGGNFRPAAGGCGTDCGESACLSTLIAAPENTESIGGCPGRQLRAHERNSSPDGSPGVHSIIFLMAWWFWGNPARSWTPIVR